MSRSRKHAFQAGGIVAYEGIDSDGRTFIRLVMTGKKATASLDLTQAEGEEFGRNLVELAKQQPLETMTPAGTA